MSPEAEAQKVIAISLGKIASSRIQRGGPKLCKNLLVANLIHKARTLVEEPFQCYYPSYEHAQAVVSNTSESMNSTTSALDTNSLDMTEVPCEDDEMTSGRCSDDRLNPETETFMGDNFNKFDDKENDSTFIDSVYMNEVPENHTSTRPCSDTAYKTLQKVPSRCLKRRNSCSARKMDFESHRSPKRLCDHRSSDSKTSNTLDALHLATHNDEAYSSDCSDFSGDSMDVEQISTLVSAFSNSFKDFCCTTCTSIDVEILPCHERNPQNRAAWKSTSVPDMVLCAQQASNILKMRQQSFETSTPVVA